CVDDRSCQQGLACETRYDPAEDSYETVCGDPCEALGSACGSTYCGAYEVCGSDLVCRPLPVEGEPCPDFTCVWPSICDSLGPEPWICVAAGENGELCSDVPTCLGTCIDGICGSETPWICHWDPR